MNSTFCYMYRDASNWKKGGSVTLTGQHTPELEARLKAALDDDRYFIASQINVPEVFLWNPNADYDPDDPETYPEDLGKDGYAYREEDDHCWHEYTGLESTDKPATDTRTIEQFVAQVEAAAKEGWEEFDPAQRLQRL